MNFSDLIERHPEIVQDRHALTFAASTGPRAIAAALAQSGVVLLKKALPVATLEDAAVGFRGFARSFDASSAKANSNAYGSWHSPWTVRDGDRFPAGAVTSAIIRSWIWEVVEHLCGTPNIVILLKWCMARHCIDMPLGVGGHQDAKVVAPDVPFSIWIPFDRVVPGRDSGLGFVVPAPESLLPTLPHDDIGADYVLGDPARLWLPSYEPGDLTIHSALSPHFTTGYGTGSDRFSLEVRAMARHKTPAQYLDPAIHVARRQGIPTIVDSCATNGEVERFLVSVRGA